MSELTQQEYEQDCKPLAPLPPEMLAMKAAVDQIDSFFAPHLARAEAQSRKIAKAARTFRETIDEDADQEPWSAQP